MYRLFRWVLWSLTFSLLPFVSLLTIRFIEQRTWPGLDPVIGSGQLLLTCVALLAGGLKELSGMPGNDRPKGRDATLGAVAVFVALIAIVYGSLANEVITAAQVDPAQQSLVTTISLVCLGVSVILTILAVMISAPAKIDLGNATLSLPDDTALHSETPVHSTNEQGT